MKYFFIGLTLSLTGCANQAFFFPSQPETINPNIEKYHSSSGNQIAILNKKSVKTDKIGKVFHFHGNHGHMEQTIEKVDWLTEHGFDVVTFDYSGFGLSTGKITDKNAYLDTLSILDYIAEEQKINNQKIFVIATSTGANLLSRALLDRPISVDGIIIDSGFNSFVQIAEHVLETSFLGKSYAWFAHVIIRDDFAAIHAHTPINEKKHHSLGKNSILAIHCVNDKVVPIHFGKKLYQQLNKHMADDQHQFWALSDCKHARGMTRDFPKHQQKIIHWLKNADKRELTAKALHQCQSLQKAC